METARETKPYHHQLSPTVAVCHLDSQRQQRPRRLRIHVVSLLLIFVAFDASADLDKPREGTLIARCAAPEDHTLGDTLRDDVCAPSWTDDLHHESYDYTATPWWERWYVGPLPPSEQDLALLYRPGERRPLWGY